MSLPKVKDLRNLSAGDLDQKKNALEKEWFELRLKKTAGTLDKPHAFKLVRRQIAQILTVKREMDNAKRS